MPGVRSVEAGVVHGHLAGHPTPQPCGRPCHEGGAEVCAEAWDHQIEGDVVAGKLDAFAAEALADAEALPEVVALVETLAGAVAGDAVEMIEIEPDGLEEGAPHVDPVA